MNRTAVVYAVIFICMLLVIALGNAGLHAIGPIDTPEDAPGAFARALPHLFGITGLFGLMDHLSEQLP